MKLLIFICLLLTGPAIADNHLPKYRISFLAGVTHLEEDNVYCGGGEIVDINDDAQGVFFGYENFIIGRFKNSHSNCSNADYSNYIGLEGEIASFRNVLLTLSAGFADGYIDEDSKFIPSVNFLIADHFKVLWNPEVIGFGLEAGFD